MKMVKIREVAVSGFSADPNPNVTPPTAGTTYVMANSLGDQLGVEQVEGHRMCIRFVDDSNAEVVGPTADFRTWIKDDGATAALGRPAFVGLAEELAAPSSQSYAAAVKGEIFVQVLGIASPGSATKCQVWFEESTSVPG